MGIFQRFWRGREGRKGNAAVIFAIAIIPLVGAMGAAVDYSMANSNRSSMQKALDAANLAASKDEVPVGAVIVYDGEIIATGYNLREGSNDPTTHAEIVAIREAAQKLGSWRLIDTTLYVTLEPCPM